MYYKLLKNHLNGLRMAMVIVVWWVFMHQLGIVYVLQSGSTYRQQAQTSTFPLYTTYSVLKKSNFWDFKILAYSKELSLYSSWISLVHYTLYREEKCSYIQAVGPDEHFSSVYNVQCTKEIQLLGFQDFGFEILEFGLFKRISL